MLQASIPFSTLLTRLLGKVPAKKTELPSRLTLTWHNPNPDWSQLLKLPLHNPTPFFQPFFPFFFFFFFFLSLAGTL